MEQEKDARLWRIATARAAFRRSLFAYIIINLFLWAIWWFTSGRFYVDVPIGVPWPVWVMLGWGIGLAFQYFKPYQGDRIDLAEQEYEKLRQQQGRS